MNTKVNIIASIIIMMMILEGRAGERGRNHLTLVSSTSKVSFEFGGILGGAPFAPYLRKTNTTHPSKQHIGIGSWWSAPWIHRDRLMVIGTMDT